MMEANRNQESEKAIWELYLQKCKEQGTEPSIEDFTAWAKALVSGL